MRASAAWRRSRSARSAADSAAIFAASARTRSRSTASSASRRLASEIAVSDSRSSSAASARAPSAAASSCLQAIDAGAELAQVVLARGLRGDAAGRGERREGEARRRKPQVAAFPWAATALTFAAIAAWSPR